MTLTFFVICVVNTLIATEASALLVLFHLIIFRDGFSNERCKIWMEYRLQRAYEHCLSYTVNVKLSTEISAYIRLIVLPSFLIAFKVFLHSAMLTLVWEQD